MISWRSFMKNNKAFKNIIAVSALSAIALSSVIVAITVNGKEKKVDAYSINSLPTTIDLNDSAASEVRNYYSSLNSLSASERSGTNLLKNLKGILKNGQKYYSYDYSNGTSIWQIYEISDRDWSKSPASSTSYGTYNSSTNKITNYSYGTNSSTKNNPYLHALYVNRNVTNQVRAWGNHNQDEWGINREHVWAKSHGMGSDDSSADSGGARGDPMHLMAGNGNANRVHSNYFYGFVNTSSSYTDCGSTYSNQTGNLLGTSLNKGSGTVFEPQDCDKGDIARAIFYMAARYNNYDGDTNIDANNPSLRLVDTSTDSNGTSTYDSTSSKNGNMGILRDLLAWNRLDPPDEWEIHRNNLLYKNYTNNRNPFIDFPEWAEYIWGESTLASNNRTITSYSSTSTGSASPSSDTLNDFNGDIAPTAITLNATSTTIGVGATFQASVTSVTPSNASTSVNWTSNKTNIATVDSTGLITGKAAGTATITATSTLNSSIKKTISVTVQNISVTGISVSPTSLSIGVGETSSLTPSYTPSNATAPTYSWTSSNNNVATVTNGVVTGVAQGTAVITVSDGNGHTATCNVTVSEAAAYPYILGVKYKFYMTYNGTNYFNGEIQSSYYGKTSTSYSNGVYVYFEKNGSGLNLYCYLNSTKTYICIEESGTYKNFTLKTSAPTYSFVYESENDTIYTTIGTYKYYFGGKTGTTYTTIGAYSNTTIGYYTHFENTAEVFAHRFLYKIGCDATGNNAPTFATGFNWSQLNTLYSNLNTVEQNNLKNATANENSSDIVEKAMARYDFICRKYGSSTFSNFINRSSANGSNFRMFAITNDNKTLIILAISASICFVGLVVFLSIRKKRKQY